MLLALWVAPSGCTGWRLASAPPATVVRARQPTTVRVVRAAGDTVWIDSPVVDGDTLLGTGSGRERVAIALADIRLLETREIEVGRTLSGIGAIVVSVSLVWFAMAASALSGGY